MKQATVKILLYYMLLFLVLFVMPCYVYFTQRSQQSLSLLKVVQFIKENLNLLLETEPQQWQEQINYYCGYEKRKKELIKSNKSIINPKVDAYVHRRE